MLIPFSKKILSMIKGLRVKPPPNLQPPKTTPMSPGISPGAAAPLLNPCTSPLVQSRLLVQQPTDLADCLSIKINLVVSQFLQLVLETVNGIYLGGWLWQTVPVIWDSRGEEIVLRHICCASVSICGYVYSCHQLAWRTTAVEQYRCHEPS